MTLAAGPPTDADAPTLIDAMITRSDKAVFIVGSMNLTDLKLECQKVKISREMFVFERRSFNQNVYGCVCMMELPCAMEHVAISANQSNQQADH